MADKKISELTDGAAPQDTDQLVVARAGSSLSVLWSALKAAVYAPGGTDVAVADGGTGGSTAADARTNLGLGTLATQSGTFSGTSSGTNTGDVGFATNAVVLGSSAAAGAASTVMRSNDTIAAFDATVPTTQAFADAAATGSAAFAARRDHSHAMPANPVGTSWTTVTKASDESVSANTTVQNDDELFFTVASGGIYEIQACIIYASPLGGATPDLKCGFGEDGTVRGVMAEVVLGTADGAGIAAASSTQSGNFSFGTAASNRATYLWGTHTGNGGTFRFLWAQNTSDSNATTVRAGSTLRYRRIV